MAFFVAARSGRGVLRHAAGRSRLAIAMGRGRAAAGFAPDAAGVAAPAWFARDKDGLADPALPPGLLGLLVLVLIAVQILLIVFAMRGFQQEWSVEVEEGHHEDDGYQEGSAQPQRA